MRPRSCLRPPASYARPPKHTFFMTLVRKTPAAKRSAQNDRPQDGLRNDVSSGDTLGKTVSAEIGRGWIVRRPAERHFFTQSDLQDSCGKTVSTVRLTARRSTIWHVLWEDTFGCDPHRACVHALPKGRPPQDTLVVTRVRKTLAAKRSAPIDSPQDGLSDDVSSGKTLVGLTPSQSRPRDLLGGPPKHTFLRRVICKTAAAKR